MTSLLEATSKVLAKIHLGALGISQNVGAETTVWGYLDEDRLLGSFHLPLPSL